jgi:hypothetical protein
MRQWPDGSISSHFLYEVALGLIPGWRTVHKFGKVVLATQNVKEDVWSYGGNYTWPTTLPHYISSSAAGDTQNISIEGLDSSKKLVEKTYTLEGQLKKSIGDWYRIFRIKNISASNFAGNIYAYENTTVTTGIPNDPTKITAYIGLVSDVSQTHMTMYTVPADEQGLIIALYPKVDSRLAHTVTGNISIRNENGVFRPQEVYNTSSSGTSYGSVDLKAGIIVEPGTDIIVDATGSSNGLGTGFSYDLLLKEI